MSRCEICRYARSSGTRLECRLNPPPWHSVGLDDWCSFWEMAAALNVIKGSAGDVDEKEETRRRYRREWMRKKRMEAKK